MNLSRRNFLKLIGASSALLGLGAKFAPPTLKIGTRNAPIGAEQMYGILIDTTRCVGCRSCQKACKEKNNLPADGATTIPYGKTYPERLTASTYTVVEFHDVDGNTDPAKSRPAKRQCMNCVNPSCVAACTVGALQKRADGPVTYDSNRCIGCRYCMYACPFGIPTFEWDKQLSLIRKCDMCADLVAQGKQPACVQACPAGALTFGKRDELLTIANQRIHGGGGDYIQRIYGEHEIGGTGVMYLASVPFDKLGLPELPDVAPAEINAEVMHSTPMIGGTMALVLSGIYWMIKGRDRLEKI